MSHSKYKTDQWILICSIWKFQIPHGNWPFKKPLPWFPGCQAAKPAYWSWLRNGSRAIEQWSGRLGGLECMACGRVEPVTQMWQSWATASQGALTCHPQVARPRHGIDACCRSPLHMCYSPEPASIDQPMTSTSHFLTCNEKNGSRAELNGSRDSRADQ